MRLQQFEKIRRTRLGRRYFQMAASVLLLAAASFVSPPRAALADDTAEDLRQLRAAIQKELADLKKREQKLRQEFLRLDQKSQLAKASGRDRSRPNIRSASRGSAGSGGRCRRSRRTACRGRVSPHFGPIG
jgi:hypothetical protein